MALLNLCSGSRTCIGKQRKAQTKEESDAPRSKSYDTTHQSTRYQYDFHRRVYDELRTPYSGRLLSDRLSTIVRVGKKGGV